MTEASEASRSAADARSVATAGRGADESVGDGRDADPAAERVDRWFARRPALALAALLPVGAATPLFPVELGVATFALGTLAVGMAHGAVDHLVPLRAAPGVSLRRSIAVVSVGYAVLGGAVVAAFFAAPVAAFVGFIALTWLHWGQGDVATLAIAGVDHLPTSAERWLALIVRGGLPMGVPLLAHPEEYRLVAEWIVGLFLVDGGAAATAVDPLFAPAVRAGVGVGMAAATLASVGLGYRRVRGGRDAGGWRRDAGELAVLWTWFLLAAPVFAIGVYFALWHALRHVGRLVLVDPAAASAASAGDAVGALARFGRDAAPLTLGGFLVVGAVGVSVPAGVAAPGDLLAVSLVAIAAMTLPHVVVVAWLDRREGVWRPGAGA
ncbi:Brp/Blh family beta-carotene 15,15'-dioxygenase [Halorubrum ezzemoulense]|uniref:Brp/Blh family beta-carotene 15,15'-dioxygenase n=1 Tax=Halorubrum ezzemoulense TaxID=337243 RepID=UPI00232D42F9|nr:Brp/Blh family beta-carotene 15,15'-dioxygenase [Halorubrum ezzemoulense]MDB9249002.1 Brp/Blh family beta-carotene 15,15'-dioxygenase [Halorubrum ezzemoulense]MDB9260129.1 Brp/Blh family beta-carotene 15,15'-dioxygenase [Halorubrum ezzemoulense]MDB9262762.1 Brp/Blh family beta-carotene 15,15'-dioxygenase [Halorubrum ezzemoulense]MDB9265679.1 Brp/Blh family beta-carotene 15,15'-dioxygenase [Halorubrum ezzemoulense]MDB9270490.1 Brp/Blh family beta-carotene 15,15'-dioxygenase [Halorubrum ezzem